MNDFPPSAPEVSASALTAMADYADELVAWLEADQAEAARHGHPPDSLKAQIDGWKFVAVAMREWNESDR